MGRHVPATETREVIVATFGERRSGSIALADKIGRLLSQHIDLIGPADCLTHGRDTSACDDDCEADSRPGIIVASCTVAEFTLTDPGEQDCWSVARVTPSMQPASTSRGLLEIAAGRVG